MRPLTVIALAFTVGALWITRHAWRSPWERPALVNVVLQTFKLLAVVPWWTLWVSSKLHTFTGVWNCEELIGHLCYIMAMQTLLFMVVSRLDMTPGQFRSYVRYRIELPGILVISLMIALFVTGPGRYYVRDTVTTEDTEWLRVYWLVIDVFLTYVLAQITQALLILRTDPRSRKAANLYLCAVGITAACIVAFQLEILWMQWVLIRVEVIAYAVAASYTWHSKRRADVPSDYLLT